MRPKKRVYILDGNEERRSIRSFLLTNKGYQVFTEAPDKCNLVMACWPVTVEAVKIARAYEAPLLLVVDHLTSTAPLLLGADQVIHGEMSCPWVIVEAVRAMSVGKRGPKPAVRIQPDGKVKVA